MGQTFGMGGFGALEEQARRNMELFQRTFSMFGTFGRQDEPDSTPANGEKAAAASEGDLGELRRQLQEMQARLDRLSDKDKDKT
jgi:polyhydroxyalkanoate synthesis regulator protein